MINPQNSYKDMVLSRSIDSLKLPEKIENILYKKNIINLRQFTRLKRKRMLKFKGIGNKTAGFLMKLRKKVLDDISSHSERLSNEISKPTALPDSGKGTGIFGEPNVPKNISLNDHIEMLDLPLRLENALKMNYIETIKELRNCPIEKVFKFRNVGIKSLNYLATIKTQLEIKFPIVDDDSEYKLTNNNETRTETIKEEELIPTNTLMDLLLDRAENDRSKKIIKSRYGLQTGGKETLEEIGNWFGITRERVRQIQAKTLRKMKHPSTKGRSLILLTINKTLEENGGIISDEEADILIPKAFDTKKYDGSSFLDLLSDLGWVQKNRIGDINFYASRDIKPVDITKLMEDVYSHIKSSPALLSVENIFESLSEKRIEYKESKFITDQMILKICKIDPRIEEKLPDKFGLYLFHPSTADWCRQIVEILCEDDCPLHFTEISNKLNDRLALTSDRRLDVRRVHSILIENPEFSHTGVRGTYGLTEWGFRKETTAELVEECIIKAGFPLNWKQIYNYVSKYKDTKPNNIMAILHSQGKFVRVKTGTFDLKK